MRTHPNRLFAKAAACAALAFTAGTGHGEECPIFGLPQLTAVSARSCSELADADSDGDGTPDWSNQLEGRPTRGVLIPADDDLDGDGIENLFDATPLARGTSSYFSPHTLPPHLVRAPQATAEVMALQKELWEQTGIVAVHFPETHNRWQLSALLHVLTHGLPPGGARRLTALQKVYTQVGSSLPWSAMGYFVNDLRAIVLSRPMLGKSSGETSALHEVLAHEIGHAALFSLLTPDELLRLAQQWGPWRFPGAATSVMGFHDPILLLQHPLRNDLSAQDLRRLEIPNRYALASIHEWFAEMFALWMMDNMGERSQGSSVRIPDGLRERFRSLFFSAMPPFTAGAGSR